MTARDAYLHGTQILGAHSSAPITDIEVKRRIEARKVMRRLIATRASAIYQEAS